MRTLLAHSARVVAILLLSAHAVAAAPTVPRSIGNLSDYGAVFDRHGRAEVNASIAEISRLLRIDVYILLTWESAYPTVDLLASAAFSAWGLTPRRAVLAVFLRSGRDWTASVLAATAVRSQLPGIERDLAARIADLVAHGRIEEAVHGVLNTLLALPVAEQAQTRAPRGGPHPALVVGASLAGAATLAALVRWRICPRCVRVLRVQRSRFGESRVYYCRRCGYRRER